QTCRAVARVHGDHYFVHQIGRLRPDHVKAEDTVATTLNDQLGETGRGTENLAFGEIGVVDASRPVVQALIAAIFLAQADRANPRVAENGVRVGSVTHGFLA